MKSYVYVIQNIINNKIYIGKTRSVNLRWSQHKSKAFTKQENRPLYNAMRKYGINSFKINVLKIFDNEDRSYEYERILINLFQSRNRTYGYNIAEGGQGSKGFKVKKYLKNKYKKLYSGEASVRSKLTNKNAEDILKLYCDGKFTIKELAYKFNVSKAAIQQIICGNTFKNIKRTIGNDEIIKIGQINRTTNLSRGEDNNFSKLTESKVIDIITKYKSGLFSYNDLSKQYNVTKQAIYAIIKRKTWKQING